MIPYIAAGIVGLGTFIAISLKDKAPPPPKPFGSIPPDFNSSPPAAQAVPPGKIVLDLPVMTQQQFSAQDPGMQAAIRQDALAGILTLSGSNGSLFVESMPTEGRANNFQGPNCGEGKTRINERGEVEGCFVAPGERFDANRPMMIVADAGEARRLGCDFPGIPNNAGNVLLEVTGQKATNTHIRAFSRDPRITPDGAAFMVPLAALTGVGDA